MIKNIVYLKLVQKSPKSKFKFIINLVTNQNSILPEMNNIKSKYKYIFQFQWQIDSILGEKNSGKEIVLVFNASAELKENIDNLNFSLFTSIKL